MEPIKFNKPNSICYRYRGSIVESLVEVWSIDIGYTLQSHHTYRLLGTHWCGPAFDCDPETASAIAGVGAGSSGPLAGAGISPASRRTPRLGGERGLDPNLKVRSHASVRSRDFPSGSSSLPVMSLRKKLYFFLFLSNHWSCLCWYYCKLFIFVPSKTYISRTSPCWTLFFSMKLNYDIHGTV